VFLVDEANEHFETLLRVSFHGLRVCMVALAANVTKRAMDA